MPPPGHDPSQSEIFSLKSTAKVWALKRIPKAARKESSLKLASILDDVVKCKSCEALEFLLHFSSHCLKVPENNQCNKSLSTQVKQRLVQEQDPIFMPMRRRRVSR